MTRATRIALTEILCFAPSPGPAPAPIGRPTPDADPDHDFDEEAPTVPCAPTQSTAWYRGPARETTGEV